MSAIFANRVSRDSLIHPDIPEINLGFGTKKQAYKPLEINVNISPWFEIDD